MILSSVSIFSERATKYFYRTSWLEGCFSHWGVFLDFLIWSGQKWFTTNIFDRKSNFEVSEMGEGSVNGWPQNLNFKSDTDCWTCSNWFPVMSSHPGKIAMYESEHLFKTKTTKLEMRKVHKWIKLGNWKCLLRKKKIKMLQVEQRNSGGENRKGEFFSFFGKELEESVYVWFIWFSIYVFWILKMIPGILSTWGRLVQTFLSSY